MLEALPLDLHVNLRLSQHAGLMLTSAVTPDEALAARSGGRVGGSAFKSAPRAAPRQR